MAKPPRRAPSRDRAPEDGLTGWQIVEGILSATLYLVIFVVPLWIELEITRGLVAIGRGIAWLGRWVVARFSNPLPRAVALPPRVAKLARAHGEIDA